MIKFFVSLWYKLFPKKKSAEVYVAGVASGTFYVHPSVVCTKPKFSPRLSAMMSASLNQPLHIASSIVKFEEQKQLMQHLTQEKTQNVRK